jgi:hypothetical protein
MRDALYAPGSAPSSASAVSRQLSKLTTSFFTSILGALHESRRRQAQRTLQQYRHLIARPSQRNRDDSDANGGRP